MEKKYKDCALKNLRKEFACFYVEYLELIKKEMTPEEIKVLSDIKLKKLQEKLGESDSETEDIRENSNPFETEALLGERGSYLAIPDSPSQDADGKPLLTTKELLEESTAFLNRILSE